VTLGSQISIPPQHTVLPAQHTVLQAESKLLSDNNGINTSHSALGASREDRDQLAAEEQLSCSGADDRPCPDPENYLTVSVVSTDSTLLNPDATTAPCQSDDVTATSELDEAVTEASTVMRQQNAMLQEYSVLVNAGSESDLCNGNLKDVEQSPFIEALSEVCRDVTENVCSQGTEEAESVSISQSELSDSVVSELMIYETADEECGLIVSVGGEDVMTERHLSPVSEPSVIVQYSTTLEEVDVTETIADVLADSNEVVTVESAVSDVPEQPVLCPDADTTDDEKKCMADRGTQLPKSCAAQPLPLEKSSVLSTHLSLDVEGHQATCSDVNGPLLSQQSVDGDAQDTAMATIDERLTTMTTYSDTQRIDDQLLVSCTADNRPLSADMHATIPSSATETAYLHNRDAAVSDQYSLPPATMNFTIGQSSITENTLRRCSLDMSGGSGGRGSLSRIAEESSAGLAAISGGDVEECYTEQELQQQDTASGK